MNFKKCLYWLLLIFVLYLTFEILRKIFGGSLGFEELIIGLIITNISLTFHLKESINKVDNKITKHLGWHRGREE